LIAKLQNERDFLLCKFDHQQALNVRSLLENKDLSLENLVSHKAVIEQLLGKYFDMQDLQSQDAFKKKYFDKEYERLLYDHERIRISPNINAKLERIDP
jgi:hypothetical protein